ncbi:hypothetical protein BJ138DRAFT_1055798 [Hygrophoropsis aurantiaca]|uniref:Uncharacterized protein n=1 Tax=Hygrophoropsis aurantiaca TaxID=72124 RepID=A0ACB8AQ14_9AGAM|nr:hypothetical protein BJ138DRAFT_1055798 [Hygrophoropsis aurantiaca]
MSDLAEQEPLISFSHDAEGTRTARLKGTVGTWRKKVGRFLESPHLHTFVIVLIAIDASCVLADLGYSFLADGCVPEGPEFPTWLEVLANISRAITTLFLIEIPVTIWAFGLRFYIPFSGITHAALHLFDAFIIITTFVLEFVLRGKERELAGLLIILRLWRLVKLVGGIAVGAGEVEEELNEELEETKRQLEGTITALSKAREENRKLRSRVAWLETGGSEGSE